MSDIFTTNPLPGTINGSLWTLVYEFTLYFLVMLSAFCRFVPKRIGQAISIIIVAACAYATIKYKSYLDVREFFWGLNLYYVLYFSSLFFFGSVLSSLKFNEWKGLNWYCATSGLLLVIAIYFNVYSIAAHLLLPIFIISVGYVYVPEVSRLYNKFGDLSYGVYIYGFVIQQTLINVFAFDVYELMIISLIISLLCGLASWKFIESKAMRYKGAFAAYARESASVEQKQTISAVTAKEML